MDHVGGECSGRFFDVSSKGDSEAGRFFTRGVGKVEILAALFENGSC